jgi:hypothetical protein
MLFALALWNRAFWLAGCRSEDLGEFRLHQEIGLPSAIEAFHTKTALILCLFRVRFDGVYPVTQNI